MKLVNGEFRGVLVVIQGKLKFCIKIVTITYLLVICSSIKKVKKKTLEAKKYFTCKFLKRFESCKLSTVSLSSCGMSFRSLRTYPFFFEVWKNCKNNTFFIKN